MSGLGVLAAADGQTGCATSGGAGDLVDIGIAAIDDVVELPGLEGVELVIDPQYSCRTDPAQTMTYSTTLVYPSGNDIVPRNAA